MTNASFTSGLETTPDCNLLIIDWANEQMLDTAIARFDGLLSLDQTANPPSVTSEIKALQVVIANGLELDALIDTELAARAGNPVGAFDGIITPPEDCGPGWVIDDASGDYVPAFDFLAFDLAEQQTGVDFDLSFSNRMDSAVSIVNYLNPTLPVIATVAADLLPDWSVAVATGNVHFAEDGNQHMSGTDALSADAFVFNVDSGKDTILDFNMADDELYLIGVQGDVQIQTFYEGTPGEYHRIRADWDGDGNIDAGQYIKLDGAVGDITDLDLYVL